MCLACADPMRATGRRSRTGGGTHTPAAAAGARPTAGNAIQNRARETYTGLPQTEALARRARDPPWVRRGNS